MQNRGQMDVDWPWEYALHPDDPFTEGHPVDGLVILGFKVFVQVNLFADRLRRYPGLNKG